jgi:hypothetical protein
MEVLIGAASPISNDVWLRQIDTDQLAILEKLQDRVSLHVESTEMGSWELQDSIFIDSKLGKKIITRSFHCFAI